MLECVTIVSFSWLASKLTARVVLVIYVNVNVTSTASGLSCPVLKHLNICFSGVRKLFDVLEEAKKEKMVFM